MRRDQDSLGRNEVLRVTDTEIYESNLQHFQVTKRYNDRAQAKCPAHDDRQASLTITKGRKCT